MTTKREVLDDPNSCLNKASDDEPIFVIRAKDPLAEEIIRIWARRARARNLHEEAKIKKALRESEEAYKWRKNNVKG